MSKAAAALEFYGTSAEHHTLDCTVFADIDITLGNYEGVAETDIVLQGDGFIADKNNSVSGTKVSLKHKASFAGQQGCTLDDRGRS